LVRRIILRPAVSAFLDSTYSEDGVFVEMGCGTGEASSGIPKRNRRLVGLDFSRHAILSARALGVYDDLVLGDIRGLPFHDDSLDGIWNLGVMEHFDDAVGLAILEEFFRVLRPGAHAVLFWPPEHGSSRLVLGPLERLLSWTRRRPFQFFPDEVNRLVSKNHGWDLLSRAGFNVVGAHHTWRDGFVHIVMVGRKE
jgi:SAM-dependent methyltransferase